MPVNAFIGKTEAPTDEEVAGALGSSKAVWDQVLAEVGDAHGLAREWNSYSAKYGWSLRLKLKKRNIVYFVACQDGQIEVLFILGAKAVAAAREGGLSKRMLEIFDTAPKYPEGTGIRFELRGVKDIPAVKKLTAAKLAH